MTRAAVAFPDLIPHDEPAPPMRKPARAPIRRWSGDRLILLTAFAAGILAGLLLL